MCFVSSNYDIFSLKIKENIRLGFCIKVEQKFKKCIACWFENEFYFVYITDDSNFKEVLAVINFHGHILW